MTQHQENEPQGPSELDLALAAVRQVAELHRELLATLGGAPERGDHPFFVLGSGQATFVSNTLKGWSLRDTSGAGSLVYLRNGADSSAQIVAVAQIDAGKTSNVTTADRGVSCPYGLYVDVATGAVEGSIWLGAA